MLKIGNTVEWRDGSPLDPPETRPLRRGKLLVIYNAYGWLKMAEVEWKGPRGGRKISHVDLAEIQEIQSK